MGCDFLFIGERLFHKEHISIRPIAIIYCQFVIRRQCVQKTNLPSQQNLSHTLIHVKANKY